MRPPDGRVAGTAPALADMVHGAADFVRFPAIGATILIAELGLASSAVESSISSAVAIAFVAILFHIFAFVLNDIVDIDLDRTEPRRARMPLVTGAISVNRALAIVLITIPVSAGLTIMTTPVGTIAAFASLAAAFVGLAVYDLAGKRTPWPPLTDLIQGFGWAALLVTGAWIAGGPTPLTAVLAIYVVVFIVLTNGVHGAVRDLPNDLRRGIVTTAILLGAMVGPGDRRILSRRLMAYAWGLEAILIALTAGALSIQAGPGIAAAVATAMAVVLRVVSVLLLLAVSRRRDVPPGVSPSGAGADADLLAAGMLHLIVGLGITIVIVAASAALPLVVALAAIYVLPVLAHGWLAGAGRWVGHRSGEGLAAALPIARDLVLLTRPHNCLAAGLAVVVGAHLGGVTGLVSEPAVRAALVAALIVAAANVANDRGDVVEDRINKPDRPVAAGRVSSATAGAYAAILAAVGVLIALTFGSGSALAAVALSAASMAYSLRLKRTFLVGNLLVAALAGSTIVYGAAVLGRPTAAMAIGAVLVFVSVLSSEVLKSISDRDGDAAAGRTTVGTRFSLSTGLRFHAALTVGLLPLVLLPTIVGYAPLIFVLAGIVGVVIPNALMLVRLRGANTARSVKRVLPLSKVAWFTGLLSLIFLVPV
jgi:4-hydroxybenzoate polyprenyltransferase